MKLYSTEVNLMNVFADHEYKECKIVKVEGALTQMMAPSEPVSKFNSGKIFL